MNIKLIFSAAALLLVPIAGEAATFITYTDNAGNYSGGYSGQGGSTPGFGAFNVASTGSAGTFLYTAKNSEGGNGTPAPGTIDTPTTATSGQPQSFGLFANNPDSSTNSSVTISRAFNVPTQPTGLVNTGDAFSLDYVTGYNDAGNYPRPNTSGVSLLSGTNAVGTFDYVGGTGYFFNGQSTGIAYQSGALHLAYTLTSPTTYSFVASGAISYIGTFTSASAVTGFQVHQTNAGYQDTNNNANGNRDAYFNNLSLTAAPEPSQMGAISFMVLGLGGLLLKRRQARVI